MFYVFYNNNSFTMFCSLLQILLKWLQKAHSFLAFHYTLIIYMFLFITVFKDQQKVAANFSTDAGNKTSTNTFVLNILVDYGSLTIRAIGIHAVVAFRMNKFLRKLFNSLDQTESFLSKLRTEQENRQYCAKYRTLSLTGIAYIFTAVIGFIYQTIQYIQFNFCTYFRILQVALVSMASAIEMHSQNESLFRTFIEVNGLVLYVYQLSIVILFCLLCSIVSDQLRTITKLVQKIPTDGMNQLNELQNEHAQISSSIDLINRSFGVILFLEISYIFIGVTVISSYVMVATLSGRGWTIYFLIFSIICVHFADLIVISCSADKLKNQVSKQQKSVLKRDHYKFTIKYSISQGNLGCYFSKLANKIKFCNIK